MSREPRGIYWSGDQYPWLVADRVPPPCFLSRSNEIAPRRLDSPTRSCRTAKVRACRRVFSHALSLFLSHVSQTIVGTVFFILFFFLRLEIDVFTQKCQCVITQG
ncbi:unnamed protein product [Microthlaspi erraticum]|uniref:Uncharacterized protein n=1 Tax=Microthlaspi erraticum TaxID=1685480 RepID=A0A6D2JMP7_9BRAS|nr:unnamed protein product [Microthlaspi erraticum]